MFFEEYKNVFMNEFQKELLQKSKQNTTRVSVEFPGEISGRTLQLLDGFVGFVVFGAQS